MDGGQCRKPLATTSCKHEQAREECETNINNLDPMLPAIDVNAGEAVATLPGMRFSFYRLHWR